MRSTAPAFLAGCGREQASPETDRATLIALCQATDGRVIGLGLGGHQLRGEIPPELGVITKTKSDTGDPL